MIEDHNKQRKVAAINDFSGFGRCSLAVEIPILSAMKVQCCAVPTAIFTNHTGFHHFSWRDCTDCLDAYIRDWKATGFRFDAIVSGFLGSTRQVDFVRRFIEAFRDENTKVIIDPVMGDYGKLYPTYDKSLAESMRKLVCVADALTPNLTEACVLADCEYDPNPTYGMLEKICSRLRDQGGKDIVVSGIAKGADLVNYVSVHDGETEVISTPKIGADRSGTGDVFSSVIVGEIVNGKSFAAAVRRATEFISKAARRTVEMDLPLTDGLAIEEVLGELAK